MADENKPDTQKSSPDTNVEKLENTKQTTTTDTTKVEKPSENK